jgi:hypothetical protein
MTNASARFGLAINYKEGFFAQPTSISKATRRRSEYRSMIDVEDHNEVMFTSNDHHTYALHVAYV